MTTEEITDELVKDITLLSSARSDVINSLYAPALGTIASVENKLKDISENLRKASPESLRNEGNSVRT